MTTSYQGYQCNQGGAQSSDNRATLVCDNRSHTASAVEGEARSALMAVGVKGLIAQPAN